MPKTKVVGVTKKIFVAARADDLPALVAITTPDFYAYDGGKRFTAQTLMELTKKLHAAGKHYEWNVTDPEVHIACNFAWVTKPHDGARSSDSSTALPSIAPRRPGGVRQRRIGGLARTFVNSW
jgi:hypothetical protein